MASVVNQFTGAFNALKPSGTSNSSFFGSSGTSWFSSSNSRNASSSSLSSVGQIATYVLAVMVIMLFILIAVHFFITPIFQLRPGGPGIIPIPGGDDGVSYWTKGNPAQILEDNLPIKDKSWEYSLILDVFLQNPLQFSKSYRILFSRGAVRTQTATGTTLLGMFDTYNLIVGLKPDTNDMIVSVLSGTTGTKNEENIIVSNVPVQQSFRLGIIVMEHALEVYINGNLVKTRKYDYNLKSVTGPIDLAQPSEANIAKFQLLKIWKRILTTSEMRYAKPDLDVSVPNGALPMPSSSFCSDGSQDSATLPVHTRLQNMSLSDVFSQAESSISNAATLAQSSLGNTAALAQSSLSNLTSQIPH